MTARAPNCDVEPRDAHLGVRLRARVARVKLAFLGLIALAACSKRTEVAPFVEWHCSPDNTPRIEAPFDLVTAPSTSDARFPFMLAVIARDGTMAPKNRDLWDEDRLRGAFGILVDPAAPSEAVNRGLAAIRAMRPDADDALLVLADPSEGAPRPDPPFPATQVAIDDMKARLARDRTQLAMISATWYEASGSCRDAVDLMREASDCAAVAEAMIRTTGQASCGMDAPTALAMFSIAWANGSGKAVTTVPVDLDRLEVQAGDGATWADAALAVVARARVEGAVE